MRFAIDLDRDAALETGEVDYISAEWKLPPKAQAVRALTQLLPKHDFGQRESAAKPACAADVRVRSADRAVADTPLGASTMLRMVPLPVPGRI